MVDGVGVVRLAGAHDRRTSTSLSGELDSLLRSRACIVVDLTEASGIDGSTLAALDGARLRARRFLLVYDSRSAARRALERVNFARVFDTASSLEQATARMPVAGPAALPVAWPPQPPRPVRRGGVAADA